jgi:hypothetical protein
MLGAVGVCSDEQAASKSAVPMIARSALLPIQIVGSFRAVLSARGFRWRGMTISDGEGSSE